MNIAVRNDNSVNMQYTATCATAGTVQSCSVDTAVGPCIGSACGWRRERLLRGWHVSWTGQLVTVGLNGGGGDQVTAVVAVTVIGGSR